LLFRALTYFLLAVLPALCLAGEPVDAARQQELSYLLHQDCGSCHGMTLKGGLGPALLPEALTGKPASYLETVIAKGVPGKAMPPWEGILSPQDIQYLAQLMLSGSTP
jgi:cytochrome c55X